MSMYLEMEDLLRVAVQPTVEMIERLALGKPPIVASILAAIGTNFAVPGYKVVKIKKELKVNDRNLTDFTSAIGMSAWHLIQECRMETGFRLLRDTLLGVDEIAILIGYDTKRPFERLCQRWCGLSPAKLRYYIRRAPAEVRSLAEEVFSWNFGARFDRGDAADHEVACVRACLESRKR